MSRVVQCPTCRADVIWSDSPHRPFCSERCRLIDLGAWTEGKYRIPGEGLKRESEEDDNDEENSR